MGDGEGLGVRGWCVLHLRVGCEQLLNGTEHLWAAARAHTCPLYSWISTHLLDALHNCCCCSERPALLQQYQVLQHPASSHTGWKRLTSASHALRSPLQQRWQSPHGFATFPTRWGQGWRGSTVAGNDQLLARGKASPEQHFVHLVQEKKDDAQSFLQSCGESTEGPREGWGILRAPLVCVRDRLVLIHEQSKCDTRQFIFYTNIWYFVYQWLLIVVTQQYGVGIILL